LLKHNLRTDHGPLAAATNYEIRRMNRKRESSDAQGRNRFHLAHSRRHVNLKDMESSLLAVAVPRGNRKRQ
jgi:hypothetical protein